MADRAKIPNLREALASRAFPTVTTWNRVEGRPRSVAFGRALAAEVRDALWMLTRQWQVGEFQAEDGGSPVLAQYHLRTARATRTTECATPLTSGGNDSVTIAIRMRETMGPAPVAQASTG